MAELQVALAVVRVTAVVTIAFLLRKCSRSAAPALATAAAAARAREWCAWADDTVVDAALKALPKVVYERGGSGDGGQQGEEDCRDGRRHRRGRGAVLRGVPGRVRRRGRAPRAARVRARLPPAVRRPVAAAAPDVPRLPLAAGAQPRREAACRAHPALIDHHYSQALYKGCVKKWNGMEDLQNSTDTR